MPKTGEGGFNGRSNESDDNEFRDQSVHLSLNLKHLPIVYQNPIL